MTAADDLRAQKPASTDPDRLEREARRAEGFSHLCAMPGSGPWSMVSAMGQIVAVSIRHGAFRLHVEAQDGGLVGRWEKIEIGAVT